MITHIKWWSLTFFRLITLVPTAVQYIRSNFSALLKISESWSVFLLIHLYYEFQIYFLKSTRPYWIQSVEWWSIFGMYIWYGMYIYLGSWHICSWAVFHNDWNIFWTVCNGRIFKYPMAKMEKVQLIIILIWNFIFLGLWPKGQKKWHYCSVGPKNSMKY